ncbi:metallophosphoesterase [Plasticicumulans sp.]|uniref:WD40 domain-containing protein n=1 Tax=Plasticicumulans sp. TaxID=2307179 RepID=UPI00393EFEFE
MDQKRSAMLPSATGNPSGTSGPLRQRPQNERLLLVQWRRECQFKSVAFSPDGRWLAAGATDGLVYVLDAQTLELLRWLEGHTDVVNSVAFSPDGARLASGSEDRTVRLWNAANGAALQRLEGHRGPVTSVAFSPDGARLASGSWDNTVRLWDVASGSALQRLEGHGSLVTSVVFSPDGTRLASGSRDKTVRLWDAASGAALQRLERHMTTVTSVAFSPDGARLASGSPDSTVRLWDAASGAALQRLERHENWVTSVAFSPDGARLASGSSDNTVRLWDAASGAALQRLEGHRSTVASVAFSPDGARLASGSDDRTIRLWDVANGKTLQTLEGHTGSVVSIVFTADSEWLLSYAEDRTVRWWRLTDGASAIVARIAAPWHYKPLALAFVPAGNYALNFEDAIRIEEIHFDPAAAFRDAGQSVCLSSAKVVLLGDSGVGKSTLVRRIQTDQYQPQESTHGMELLTLAPESLGLAAAVPVGERREVVLWDLGGQEEYRLVHQLFMHDTQLALLLCDTTRGQKEYAMVREWNALLEKQRGGAPTIKLLVGSKVDDPTAIRDQAAIEDTETACGTWPFISVSAKTGHGIDELKQAMAEAIDWDEIAKTSRPALFQRIRDQIESVRKLGAVSLSLSELREQVRAAAPEDYDDAAVPFVVGQLSRQGVIVDTCRANGQRELVLKLAEIERYAGSLILMARQARSQTGIGVPAIEESALMPSELVLPRIAESQRLPREQERIVLECVVQLLIERGICLAHGGLLVFPSLYPQGECQSIDGTDSVSLYYDFIGPSDALYAQLTARAAMSARFGRVRLSAGRAEFGQRESGGLCGVQYQARGQGRGHIDIYFCPETPVTTRQLFRAFVEDFLKEHGVDVREVVELRCQECPHVFAEADVRGRIESGKASIFCPDGHPTPIDAAFKDARANNPELIDRLAALKTDVDRRTASAAHNASRTISAAPASASTAGTSKPATGHVLRLLHLSDLHFSASIDPAQMLHPLVADLTDREWLELEKLDYLVVSGDCTCIGSAAEFERVHEFLESLVKQFGLSAHRCVLVPGNHDLSWKEKVYEWQDAGEIDTAKLPDGSFIRQGDGYLVRSAEAIYSQRFKNFATFHHQFMQQPYPLEVQKQAQVYIHADDKIQFIGLNSSCRIDRYNKGRASIDGRALSHALMEAEKQIKDAVTGGRIPKSADVLRIAVWHHPITGNEKIFDDAFVQLLQQADVRLCLHGHIHENRADLIAPTHPTRKLHTIGAGSFGAVAKDRPESTPRLYNLLEIAADRSQVRVHTRQMPKAGGAWKAYADWPDEEGIIRGYYDISLRKR